MIDLRAKDGTSHHLKVGMSAELMDGVEVETFDKLAPRGRSMALVYLRNLSYEEVTDPTQYERIAKELTERMKEALGDTVVHRIHIVDYVAQ